MLPGSVYVHPTLAEDMAHCLQHEQAAQVGVELPRTLAALLWWISAETGFVPILLALVVGCLGQTSSAAAVL